MITVPIGSYFLTVNNLFGGKQQANKALPLYFSPTTLSRRSI
jgi:hypothetical protein